MNPPTVQPDFGSISVVCAKPDCDSTWVQRHHIRHEKLFIRFFAHKQGQKKYEQFRRRYEEFREEDISAICPDHHAEAHWEYRHIIQRHYIKVGRPLSQYTWKEAEELMERFATFYSAWIATPTLGMDPSLVFGDYVE